MNGNKMDDELREKIEEYSLKSHDELMDELKKSAGEGGFNEAEFENFREMILPMLDDRQAKMLDELKAVMQNAGGDKS